MANYETRYSVVNRVLVVDDDESERATLKGLLVDEGFTVETAKDGGQAHASFTMHKPDLVVLDLILPNESGFEVCERMKTEDESVPIVVYTAIQLDDSKSLAERVGADHYLTKPTPNDEIVAAIRDTAEEVWRAAHLESPSDTGEKVRFKCPSCGVSMKVRSAHRGRQMSCPKCGNRVIVPRS